MEESFALILQENRVKVDKEKLANKSRYFASLFSHNFNDSHSTEHKINYDIALTTLQDFVNWIQDDGCQTVHYHNGCDTLHYHNVKQSMLKFMKDDFSGLLNLLELSVLFTTDQLTYDATEILVLWWLSPDKVIEIWRLAQELNLRELQNICFAVCLDRFEELGIPALVQLSKDNIKRLIENVNVRSTAEHLRFVQDQWIKHHADLDVANIKEERKPKFVGGIVIWERSKEALKFPWLFTWDGCVLSKLVELKNVQASGKYFCGMQVVGRGFNVYTVGGEMGIGTGHFNHTIWRYCLLSEKWYYQAKLPVSRRHMVTVFIKNKLMMVGGVGRHRLKLHTVDILDIHTGKWKGGAEVPESFTDVPVHCVLSGKLFLLKSSLYVYFPEENYWQTISLYSISPAQVMDSFLANSIPFCLIGKHFDEIVPTRVESMERCTYEGKLCLKHHNEYIVSNTSVVHENELHQSGYKIPLENADIDTTTANLNSNDRDSFTRRVRIFSIIHPDTLYDTV